MNKADNLDRQVTDFSKEIHLLAAMIERAILDLKSKEYIIRIDAAVWLLGMQDGTPQVSYKWCLEHLDIPKEFLDKIKLLAEEARLK